MQQHEPQIDCCRPEVKEQQGHRPIANDGKTRDSQQVPGSEAEQSGQKYEWKHQNDHAPSRGGGVKHGPGEDDNRALHHLDGQAGIAKPEVEPGSEQRIEEAEEK